LFALPGIFQNKEKIDLIIQYMERNGDMSDNYFEQNLGGDDAESIDNFKERIS
jgi:phosphate starvation-inducible PhoH-like protein